MDSMTKAQPIEQIICQRIKEFRVEKGLSQQEIADRLKINRATYANYENGKREPSAAFIRNYSKLSKYSPSYLIGLSDYKYIAEEADAAVLSRQGDSEAVIYAAKIRQTAKNLLDRYNKDASEFPTCANFIEPLSRLCDQVDKIQKHIDGYSTDEKGEVTKLVSAERWTMGDNDKEVLDIFKNAHKACNDLMEGF